MNNIYIILFEDDHDHDDDAYPRPRAHTVYSSSNDNWCFITCLATGAERVWPIGYEQTPLFCWK